MSHPPFRFGYFAAALSLGGILLSLVLTEACEYQSSEPGGEGKLVVMVVFDQLRGDYLVKWEKLFDKDGFGRMLKDGAWYQDCHYPYAYTLTAPGHASIATGCAPNKHGIVGNEWYDRSARKEVGAVEADRYRTIPTAIGQKKLDGPSPERLNRPTVADALHKMSKGKARVVSLSIKDRSAILMALFRDAIVYWFNIARGLFVTSSYYSDTVHPWVQDFNNERFADKYFGKNWTLLNPELDYAKHSSKDDVAIEGIGYKQGRTFPHDMTGGLVKPGSNYYDAFATSPYGNEMLLELAKRAIDAEKLGQRGVCDMLCVSFSSNDLVGHCWGPDSQEVLDVTLRSDLIVKELLNYLDAKVGKDRYVVIISADHGVAPIPEVAKAQGLDGVRMPSNTFTSKASAMLQAKFAPAANALPWIEKYLSGWIYLNQAALKEAGVSALQAEQALLDWLPKQPGVQSAYGRSRLEKGPIDNDQIGESVRLSFDPERSGDVGVVIKPYHMISGAVNDKNSPAYRATHGTPHFYDTHVPLLVFGGGVMAQVSKERVTPMAAAAIGARFAGIDPPSGAEYPVPKGLFK